MTALRRRWRRAVGHWQLENDTRKSAGPNDGDGPLPNEGAHSWWSWRRGRVGDIADDFLGSVDDEHDCIFWEAVVR